MTLVWGTFFYFIILLCFSFGFSFSVGIAIDNVNAMKVVMLEKEIMKALMVVAPVKREMIFVICHYGQL